MNSSHSWVSDACLYLLHKGDLNTITASYTIHNCTVFVFQGNTVALLLCHNIQDRKKIKSCKISGKNTKILLIYSRKESQTLRLFLNRFMLIKWTYFFPKPTIPEEMTTRYENSTTDTHALSSKYSHFLSNPFCAKEQNFLFVYICIITIFFPLDIHGNTWNRKVTAYTWHSHQTGSCHIPQLVTLSLSLSLKKQEWSRQAGMQAGRGLTWWHETLACRGSMTTPPQVARRGVGQGSTSGSHGHSHHRTITGPIRGRDFHVNLQ